MGTGSFQAARMVIQALERLGVPYLVGGSLASSLYGIPRSTNDVDLVAALDERHVEPLVAALATEFMVDDEAIHEAIQARRSFNVIHLTTLDKIDIFVSGDQPWQRQQMLRRRAERLSQEPGEPSLTFASPEDTVLSKLVWFRRGGEVSDRQWTDVLAVLKVQGTSLDLAYLREWANQLGVADLLDRALQQAGLA